MQQNFDDDHLHGKENDANDLNDWTQDRVKIMCIISVKSKKSISLYVQ